MKVIIPLSKYHNHYNGVYLCNNGQRYYFTTDEEWGKNEKLPGFLEECDYEHRLGYLLHTAMKEYEKEKQRDYPVNSKLASLDNLVSHLENAAMSLVFVKVYTEKEKDLRGEV